jgi:hypothetical protein
MITWLAAEVCPSELAEFRRVANKENVLYTVAGVSVAHPDGLVREVVSPAVTRWCGGTGAGSPRSARSCS